MASIKKNRSEAENLFLFLLGMLIAGLSLLPSPAKSQTIQTAPKTEKAANAPTCKGMTKAGQPCKMHTRDESGFCRHHNPNKPAASATGEGKAGTEAATCKGFTKIGLPCKLKTSHSSGFCRHHNPSQPEPQKSQSALLALLAALGFLWRRPSEEYGQEKSGALCLIPPSLAGKNWSEIEEAALLGQDSAAIRCYSLHERAADILQKMQVEIFEVPALFAAWEAARPEGTAKEARARAKWVAADMASTSHNARDCAMWLALAEQRAKDSGAAGYFLINEGRRFSVYTTDERGEAARFWPVESEGDTLRKAFGFSKNPRSVWPAYTANARGGGMDEALSALGQFRGQAKLLGVNLWQPTTRLVIR